MGKSRNGKYSLNGPGTRKLQRLMSRRTTRSDVNGPLFLLHMGSEIMGPYNPTEMAEVLRATNGRDRTAIAFKINHMQVYRFNGETYAPSLLAEVWVMERFREVLKEWEAREDRTGPEASAWLAGQIEAILTKEVRPDLLGTRKPETEAKNGQD